MKKKKSNTIIKNSLMYTVGNLLLKAFNFFLLPLYTAFLTTEEYGIINLASGFYTLMASIIMLSLQYAVIRFYADIHNNKSKVSRMFGTVINFIILVSIVFLIISFLSKDIITSYFFKGITFFPVVFLSIVISIVFGLYQVYQDILKGMQNAKKSIVMSYLYFFFMLLLNVVSVVIFKLGAVGVILSTLIVNVVMVLVMFFDLFRNGLYEICIDRGILKELLKYSLPLVPHTIAFNIQTYATKVIINENLSLTLLGVYSLSSQFGSIADVILSSVQAAFQPWLYKTLNEDTLQGEKSINVLTYALMWVYGIFFIIIGAFSQEAVLLMASKSYSQSWVYVPLIVFSVALKSPLYFYSNFLYYDKRKIKYVFISTVIGCVINIALTSIFVPILGIVGSIIADIIALVVRLVFTLIILKLQFKNIYSFWKLEFYSLLPIFFMFIALFPSYMMFKNRINLFNLFFKFVVLVVYVGIAFLMNKNVLNSEFLKRKKKL